MSKPGGYTAIPTAEEADGIEFHSTEELHSNKKRPLSLWPLVALIFFEVSGGPFGTEDAVNAGGPLLVLGGFLILPLVWSVPEALVTAELATAFPENSGYVAWVTAAFGPFWGFQEGFWSWLSGVTDNSLYPVMFADNLRLFFPALAGGWPRTLFLVGTSLLLTYLNYRGLQVVGNTAMTTTIFIVLPFVLLCALCAPQVEPSNWLQVDWPSVKWGTYLNIMFWNLNYWDSVSCLAGEVADPARTFPRALLWAVLLVVAFYFLPTLAALGVMVDVGDWELGYYGKVAQQVGGNWLAWWIVAAAGASQIGQFQAEMSSDSYQLLGMAERGFLPRALAKRSRHGTPVAAIALSSLGILCLTSLSFVDIVELLNAIYCLAELLEFAAYIWLRIKAPNLPRPYKVPLPTWALVLMLLPASVLLVVVLLIPIWERNWACIATTLAAMVAGFILYPILNLAKERGWVEFANLQFDFEHPLLGSRLVYSIHASGGTNYDDTHIDVVSNGLRRSTSSATELLGGASPRSGSPRRRLSGMASPRRRLASPRRWASVDAGQGAGEQAANGSAFAAVAGADGAQEDVASALAAALAGVSEGGSSAAGSASSSSAPARAAPGRLAARTSLLKDALLQQLSSFRLEGDLSSSLGSATVVHGSLPGASRLRTSSGAGSSGAQLYWASDGGGTGDATSGPGSGVDA